MRIALIYCAIFSAITLASAPPAQPDRPGDIRSIELTSIAPPAPALKYQLQFDPMDRHPGNAAIPYMQVSMLITPEVESLVDKAMDALTAGDEAAFKDMGEQLIAKSDTIADTANLAGRCETCDWQPPIRFRGIAAILPHLGRMRQLANVLHVRAIAQARAGKIDDAVATLRLGYELVIKLGEESTLISGLVALGVASAMDATAIELMNRADAPNLYWALLNLPRPIVSMRRAVGGERLFLIGSIPVLAKTRTSSELSADEWKDVMEEMAVLSAGIRPEGTAEKPIAANSESAANSVLPQAQAHYARTRHLSADQVAKIDPIKINATYFFEQFQALSDDFYKLLGLPYSELIPRLKELEQRIAHEREAAPGNLFLEVLPSLSRAATMYARTDRQIAAMTVVEAIRSYAAAHDNKLPQRLEDITETPAPINPRSGQPFDFREIEEGKAIVSDSEPKDYPLEFTIKIR